MVRHSEATDGDSVRPTLRPKSPSAAARVCTISRWPVHARAGVCAQVQMACACHPGGRRFEPDQRRQSNPQRVKRCGFFHCSFCFGVDTKFDTKWKIGDPYPAMLNGQYINDLRFGEATLAHRWISLLCPLGGNPQLSLAPDSGPTPKHHLRKPVPTVKPRSIDDRRVAYERQVTDLKSIINRYDELWACIEYDSKAMEIDPEQLRRPLRPLAREQTRRPRPR
jgi:hypothetical protein